MNHDELTPSEIEAAALFQAEIWRELRRTIEVVRLKYDCGPCHDIATDYRNDYRT
jgi:hypothetical protein